MKIRTKENFIDFIQGERSWRKKELTNIKALIHASRSANQDVLIRAGILLVYAHWEGYIKKSCEGFFYYLNNKGVKYNELKQNFLALGVFEEFNRDFQIKKFSSYSKAVSFVIDEIGERKFNIDVGARVDTKSNLSYEVLLNLLNMIGIGSEFFENNQYHIDNRLLKYRNAIAHGERTDNNPDLNINFDDFDDLHLRINSLIDHFETLISNYLELESYRVT